MQLPNFEHLAASSIQEATQILKRNSAEAQLVAGGTDLYPRMKYGLTKPKVVISLASILPRKPELLDDGIHIEAIMTLADLARYPLVHDLAPALTLAASCIASTQIRNMGTIGGNICLENRCLYFNQSHKFRFVDPCFKRGGDKCYLAPRGNKCLSVFCADTVPALISLGARVRILSNEVAREIPVEELYTQNALRPISLSKMEALSEIVLPLARFLRGQAFFKFSFGGAVEFAALNGAVALDMEDDGVTCHDARITVGAFSAGPIRIIPAETFLKGTTLSEEVLREAAQISAAEVRPYPHHGYKPSYIRECLKVELLRAFSSSWNAAREKSKNP